MPRARLAVDLPADSWMGALTREFPAVDWRLTATMPLGDGVGRATLLAEGGDRDSAIAALAAADPVTDVTPLDDGAGATLVAFETTEPFLQGPLREADIPFEPPLVVTNGVARLTVTTDDDRLSTLGDALREAGYRFDLEAVHTSVSAAGPLTDRQETVLRAAVEADYYASPRGTDLATLADDLGVAKSSLSMTLRRAERALATRYLEDRDLVDRLSTPA